MMIHTHVRVLKYLNDEARELGFNRSSICNKALRDAIEAQKRGKNIEKNTDVCEYNPSGCKNFRMVLPSEEETKRYEEEEKIINAEIDWCSCCLNDIEGTCPEYGNEPDEEKE